MPLPTPAVVILIFDVAAALGLLFVALVDPPHGVGEIGEAIVGAAGAGTLGLAVALHGGHLGLPAQKGPGEVVAGTAGAVAFLWALARAFGRYRREPEP